MSDVNYDLHEGLRRFVKSQAPAGTFPAMVLAVNEEEGHVDVVDGDGIELYGVRIKAAIDGQTVGVWVYPEVGSTVLIGNIDQSTTGYFIVATAVVTKVRIEIGNVELEAEASGMTVKRGGEDLKEWFNDLLDGMLALTVTTAVGPSGTPINAATFTGLKTRINEIFK